VVLCIVSASVSVIDISVSRIRSSIRNNIISNSSNVYTLYNIVGLVVVFVLLVLCVVVVVVYVVPL